MSLWELGTKSFNKLKPEFISMKSIFVYKFQICQGNELQMGHSKK